MIKKLFMLALLGLGVALAVPRSRARIVTPVADRIKGTIVPRRVQALASQLESKVRRGESLPNASGWPGWIENTLAGPSTDPWGNVYYLDRTRDGYTVGSMGPDGQKGTADDITEQRRYGR